MKKRTEPQWMLTGDYGIGLDALNWRLYRKAIPKRGGKPAWQIVGYYPTLMLLMAGLQKRILLTYSDHTTLAAHINAAIEHCASAVCALNAQLDTIGAGATTKPPGYASLRRR